MKQYDAVVVGAGPVGSVAALALAQRGRKVLVVEGRKAEGLLPSSFGEWIHPPALDHLDRLGVSLKAAAPYETGRGFALFPEDGSDPIVLPYPVGTFGWSVERKALVATLRDALRAHENVELVEGARAMRIDGQLLTYERSRGSLVATAPLLVGASGRVSVAHEALYPYAPYGRDASETAVTRTASLVLRGIELPFEGWAHVFLGGLGPAVVYRIDHERVRLQLDVPLSVAAGPRSTLALWDGYRIALPPELREPFRDALGAASSGSPLRPDDAIHWETNLLRPRQDYGREGLALVGDAVGHHHPLLSIDLVLGIEDACTLADAKSHARWKKERVRDARIPETLAVALYEVLADPSPETVALRRAMFAMWRETPGERLRTMGYVSGQDRSTTRFARSCLATFNAGARNLARQASSTGKVKGAPKMVAEIARRMTWLGLGAARATDVVATDASLRGGRSIEDRYGAALKVSAARHERETGSTDELAQRRLRGDHDPKKALEKGVLALVAKQDDDGSFEGEVVWCPMLAAQYVIAWTLLAQPISDERRKNVLRHFEDTLLPSGTWGLHELSPPVLFVTTLVYVAARMLGVAPNDPLLERAGAFLRLEGGAASIPSWGKLWLALCGLYEWDGVSPILPETWLLPRGFVLHPSRWYCHTRNIYLGMASLYGERRTLPVAPELLASLRRELYPQGYESIDWKAARSDLREGDVHTPWTLPLRVGYAALKSIEPALPPARRRELLAEMREHLRWEMRQTHHTCISPVSGLLAILTLRTADVHDPDAQKAIDVFDGWVWEDEEKGARVAGARSATWDSGFAAQALAAAAPHVDVRGPLKKVDGFLGTQQITRGSGDETQYFRIDPIGGFCFAGVWHGWPVSDCTAEALLGRLEAHGTLQRSELEAGVRFILRTQGPDGGFGSYEPRRVGISLEWINPAEMFGDSMTEKGYVECTASCVALLAAVRKEHPEILRDEIELAIRRAAQNLRAAQRPDGSWPGMWGVHFVYGTMFGVRGLLAAGAPPTDPSVRAACAFLESRQRSDGGWGESHRGVTFDRYVEAESSHVVQTAWALSALLEAQHPDFACISRAAQFLASAQLPSGDWPRQEPEGIFFHTALLEYELYRAYFPVWALGLYEARVADRRRVQSGKGDRPSPVIASA